MSKASSNIWWHLIKLQKWAQAVSGVGIIPRRMSFIVKCYSGFSPLLPAPIFPLLNCINHRNDHREIKHKSNYENIRKKEEEEERGRESKLPKHCQMSTGGKNHLWLRITGVEWKLELSKQKREDGRIVMRHGIIVEENLSWPGAGAAKGHSWWPSGSPFRSKLDCGTGDPSHARYTAFWTWALLIRQTVGLCPQKEKGI